MSKYDTLWKYFQNQTDEIIELSFEEIRTIAGIPLDHSFLNYKKELEEYGYKVKKIYLKEKRVVFERC